MSITKPLTRLGLFLVVVWQIYTLLPHFDPSTPHPGKPVNQVVGAIHVSTRFSSGFAAPDEIAAAAKRAGLDFIVIADRMTSAARSQGYARSYEGLDLFVEMEADTPGGQLLTFYSHTPQASLSDREVATAAWRHFSKATSYPDWFVAIAHPSHPYHPWRELDRFAEGYEVVSLDTLWRRAMADNLLSFTGTLLIAPFNNYLASLRFLQPARKDFITWDTMNSLASGGFGYLSSDINASLPLPRGETTLPIPSYETLFRLGQNVLFLEEKPADAFDARQKQYYSALSRGHSAFVISALHPFAESSWVVACGNRTYQSGDATEEDWDRCQFRAHIPKDFPYRAEARIIRNGELLSKGEFTDGIYTASIRNGGTYRLEVWARAPLRSRALVAKYLPYLFYNPIYVR